MRKLWLRSYVQNEEVQVEQAQQNHVAKEVIQAVNA